jgi:Zn-dependent protease
VSAAARKITVSRFAFLLPITVFALDAWYLLALCAAAVAAHEAGHWLVLRLRGGEVLRVTISPLGVSLKYGGNLSYGGEILTALAGPAASLILTLGGAGAGRAFGWDAAYQLAGLSLLFGLFNLLPVYPLDGGRAVYNAAAYLFGLDAARGAAIFLRAVILGAAAAGGLWLLLRPEHNPTLLCCALALLAARE